MGNYNDVLMEQLADGGDGFYAYVDTIDEAEKLFIHDLGQCHEDHSIIEMFYISAINYHNEYMISIA